MRKRIISLLMAMLMLVSLLPVQVFAAAEMDNGDCGAGGSNVTWSLDSDGVMTVSGSGAMADYEQQETPWQEYAYDIKSVVIQNGVTAIGSNAFASCVELTDVTIPASVTGIGYDAFSFCERLTRITVSAENATFAGVDGVVYSKDQETLILAPGGITGTYAIPAGVTSVANSAFFSCVKLTGVTFPESLTTIDNYAFSWCSRLQKVDVPSTVEYIGTGAFSGGYQLTAVNVDEDHPNYTSVDGVLFSKDKTKLLCVPGGKIGEYIIPSSVTFIGHEAFAGCDSLTSVIIPNGITSIGESAFWECGGPTSITIPASVTSIGDWAFDWCDSLTDIYFGGTQAQWNAITIGDGNESLSGVTVHYNSGSAAAAAASGNCGADGSNVTWSLGSNGVLTVSGSGAMAEYNFNSMPWASHRDAIKRVVIEEGVTSICGGAFWQCENVTDVELPDSLKSIGSDAFGECSSLQEIAIPAGVTSIEAGVFRWCDKLTTITVAAGNTAYVVKNGALYTADEKTLLCVPCGKTGTYAIPGSVTTIADFALQGCKNLTSVTIPNSATSIGECAFWWCSGLNQITIPESVTSIGEGAFAGCSGLTGFNVAAGNTAYTGSSGLFTKDMKTLVCVAAGLEGKYHIPESVTAVKFAAFAGCRNLTSVVIPEGVATIGDSTFWECNYLESITIPASVTAIGVEAFTWCNSLTDIYYGGTEEEWSAIRKDSGNEKLNSVNIHYSEITSSLDSNGVLTISGWGRMPEYNYDAPWMSNSNAVKKVVIKEGVTSICDGAFWQCENVTAVELPDSLRSIGDSAFGECSSLKEVAIPAYVTLIGEGAFSNCKALTKITLDAGNAAYTVNNDALYTKNGKTLLCVPAGKTGTYTISGSVITIARSALAGCEKLTEITIPDSVTSIGSYAFVWCSGLKSITIPASVTNIEGGAFADCSGLTGFNVAADNTTYISSKGGLFTKDMKTLVCVAAGVTGEYYIPESVATMEEVAFSGCDRLTSVEIPDGVTAIGDSTFLACNSLKSITIPESVTTIGQEAFYGCSSLTDVYYGGTQEQWNAIRKDSGNEKLTSANIHYKGSATVVANGDCGVSGSNVKWSLDSNGLLTISGSGAMANYNFSNRPWELHRNTVKKVVIENGVTTIGSGAFAYCEYLTSITIPASVTKIDGSAFFSCYRLRTIRLGTGNSVYTIEGDALFTKDKKTLCWVSTDVTGTYSVPEGVTTIGDSAFCCCSGLTGVTVPASVTSIEDNAFAVCEQLAGITISDKNTKYASVNGVVYTKDQKTLLFAPSGITGTYDIPGGVTSIEYGAFFGCKRLTSVMFPSSLTSIGNYAFAWCGGLQAVYIPSTVVYVGTGAFSGCSQLAMINVEADHPNYTSEGGVLFSKDKTVLMCVPGGKTGEYRIPGNVTYIAPEAFAGCDSLSGVVIPSSITYIGDYAFSECGGPTDYTIPATVTYIGYGAFAYCDNLTNIYFGGTQAQWEAIYISGGNTSLFGRPINIWFNSRVTEVASGNCGTSGSNVTWSLDSNGVMTISGSGAMKDFTLNDTPWTAYNKSIRKVIIKEGVTSVGYIAFGTCSNLSSVTFPSSLRKIGIYAFSWCNLTSVTIPNGVGQIGLGAFCGNYQLTAVNVASNNANYTSVDGALFTKDKKTLMCVPGGKTGEYRIPESVTTIKSDAFSGCDSLAGVVLPNGITSIGDGAFWECGGPTSITIPASVTSIGDKAFAYCDKLTTIYYGGDRALWNAITKGSGNTSLDGVTIHYNSGVTVTANGSCGADGSSVNWTLYNNGLLTISGSGAMADYDFNEMPWASRRDAIKRVVIEEGVTSICVGAFWQCEKLTDVVLPDSLKSIGNDAFGECIALKEITIPKSVTSIGAGAFASCYGLTGFNVAAGNTAYTGSSGGLFTKDMKTLVCVAAGVTGEYHIPESVTTVEEGAFSGCGSLTSVVIPEGVPAIGNSTFWECSSLKSITIPASVASIGEKAFMHCDGLTVVYYGGTQELWETTTIEDDNEALTSANVYYSDNAWSLNNGVLTISGWGRMPEYNYDAPWVSRRGEIKKVVIEEGVTSICVGAFWQCEKLTDVVLPDSLKIIETDAFGECSALQRITIPRYVTKIEAGAFRFNYELTTINVAAGNTAYTVNNGALYTADGKTLLCVPCGKTGAYTIPSGVTTIADFALQGCCELTSVTIPSGVTSIGECAFWWCSGLNQITIPKSVTSIGEGAFAGCYGLNGFNVETGNTHYVGSNGGLFTKDMKTLVCVAAGVTDEYRIPESVTAVEWAAFAGCSSLTSVVIPEGVPAIGSSIFWECSSLESITIPASVTSIGMEAFTWCDNLSDVYYGGDKTAWAAIAIDGGNQALTSATVHYTSGVTVTASGSCGASGSSVNWTLYSNGLMSISGSGAMKDFLLNDTPWTAYNSSIRRVVIGEGVTSVGYIAFGACRNLSSVAFPSTLRKLGDYAFSYCDLTSVTIPKTLSEVGHGALIGNSRLAAINVEDGHPSYTSVDGALFTKDKKTLLCVPGGMTGEYSVPYGVTAMDGEAFAGCSSLTGVVLPRSIKSLADYTFWECNGIKSVTIPVSVTSIGKQAFAECASLTDIYYEGTREQWDAITKGSGNDALAAVKVCYNTELPDDPFVVGDVNGDGGITAADMQRLYTHLNGTDPLEDAAAADINGDGQVTAADMQRLYTHLNGTDPL